MRGSFYIGTAGYRYQKKHPSKKGAFTYPFDLVFKTKGKQKMKRTLTKILAAALILFTSFTLVACNTIDATGAWENATYLRDKSFGKGNTQIQLEVIAGEQSVTFTVNTDKENLADALAEHGLVDGDWDSFGLYVKYVNGIRADYTKDGAWWKLSKGGTELMTGPSGEKIADGNHYELTYTPA